MQNTHTISNISGWRAEYNFSDYVSAAEYAYCEAYLVTDTTPTTYALHQVPSSCFQTTTLEPTNSMPSSSYPEIEFSINEEDWDTLVLSYVYSTSYDANVLVGPSWENSETQAKDSFLYVSSNYSHSYSTVWKYVIRGGEFGGALSSVTTLQKANACNSNLHAIVGLSGSFNNGSVATPFSWGLSKSVCSSCTSCTTSVNPSVNRSLGITGSFGNATLFPSGYNCNQISRVAAINYLGFSITLDTKVYPNSNLLTTYPYSEYGYIYNDVYNASTLHTPMDMGCGGNVYDVDNMIILDNKSSETSYKICICACVVFTFICAFKSYVIKKERKDSYDGRSKTEVELEKDFRKMACCSCICCVCFCCFGKKGLTGYWPALISVIQMSVSYPIGLLGPAISEADQMGCYFFWDGMVDGVLAIIVFILWGVSFALFFFRPRTSKNEEKCCTCFICRKGCAKLMEFFSMVYFLVGLLVMLSMCIYSKIASITKIASVAITGINFPALWNVMKNIANVQIELPILWFLGYQITRLFILLFDVITILA